MVLTCKHCGAEIRKDIAGVDWVHVVNGQDMCKPEGTPYGYTAAPEGEPCDPRCKGHFEEQLLAAMLEPIEEDE